jgi:hypothetical protein
MPKAAGRAGNTLKENPLSDQIVLKSAACAMCSATWAIIRPMSHTMPLQYWSTISPAHKPASVSRLASSCAIFLNKKAARQPIKNHFGFCALFALFINKIVGVSKKMPKLAGSM